MQTGEYSIYVRRHQLKRKPSHIFLVCPLGFMVSYQHLLYIHSLLKFFLRVTPSLTTLSGQGYISFHAPCIPVHRDKQSASSFSIAVSKPSSVLFSSHISTSLKIMFWNSAICYPLLSSTLCVCVCVCVCTRQYLPLHQYFLQLQLMLSVFIWIIPFGLQVLGPSKLQLCMYVCMYCILP